MMRFRSVALIISVGLFFCLSETADAQYRVSRLRRSRKPPRSLPLPVNPRHEQAKREAESAYQNGKYERALQLMSRVVRENPRDHVAFYLRASARVERARQARCPADS